MISKEIQYQGLLDALKATKNQQWLVSTYVLALQVGIIKLYNDTKGSIPSGKWNPYISALQLGTWLISILGTILIIGYSYKIYEYRKEKNLIIESSKNKDGFEIILVIIFIAFYTGIAFCVNAFFNTQFK